MNILFFKLAVRNLLKNSISSLINIAGFSIGMAACIFIFLFVTHETGFDQHYPNTDKLYRVVGTYKSNNENSRSGFMWFPMAKDMKSEIAGIDDFCRVSEENTIKCYVDNHIKKIDNLRFADSNFFSFFNFQLLTGNPQTALNSTDKMVLTENKARQLFGKNNPLGKTITYNHTLFTVSGIAANPPLDTHLIFDALISSKYMEESDTYYTGYGGGVTLLSYLQLSDKVTPQQIEKAFPDFLYKKINKSWQDDGWSLSASLQNISAVHLSDGSIDYDVATNRSKKSIYIIVSISLLIVLLAIVNYIILFTAQRVTKTKDIGILKIFGAGNNSLLLQTFIEVFIITSIASIVGIFLLIIGTPFLNTYFQTSIRINTNVPLVIAFLLITILLLSILVTFFSTRTYPFSTSVKLVKTMVTPDTRKKLKGNLLISFQFTVVIILLVAVFIISRQNSFLQHTELGFDKENIITLQIDDEFQGNDLFKFKQDLRELAEIKAVSLSSEMVGSGLTKNGYIIGNEKNTSLLNVLYVDADFIKCFKMKLLSGRNFKTDTKLDKNAILINQRLVKRAGWKNPIDKKIIRNGTLKVIGVVEDFNFASLENTVQPMLIMSNPAWDDWGYSVINIRFQTSDIQHLLVQINKRWKNRFPETPLEISFLDNVLASNYKTFTAQQKIISFFSFIGIFIAVIGLLGLTIFTTRTRIKEIGVRKVNGATSKDIVLLLNKDFLKWVLIAFIIATPIAYFIMSKWLENFAYKTTLHWWIFALAGILALGISLLTVSWQSLIAAMRNPVEALRDE